MTNKETKEIVDLLEQGPALIRLAKEMISHLPKSPARDELIKNFKNVRNSLIKLDVCLQDIEWSIAYCQVLEIEKEEIKKEKNLDCSE